MMVGSSAVQCLHWSSNKQSKLAIFMASDRSNLPLSIGANHIHLKRVGSTNQYTADMIAKSKPMEGTVISAAYQYDGKGQIGRYWESEDGMNITCSTILRPIFLEASDQFRLNIAVSLAVWDFVDHYISSDDVRIKWPNDIYVGNKKIAGILVQNTLIGKRIDSSIIGTGININQVQFSDHIPNPTSLAGEIGSGFVLDDVYPWLFRFLTKRYLQLRAGKVDSQREEYLSALYRIGEEGRYISGDNEWVGTINGVDDYGRLIICRADGETHAYAFREVSMVV